MRFFRHVFIPAAITGFIFWLALSVGRDNNDRATYNNYDNTEIYYSPAYGGSGNAYHQEKMPYYIY